MRSHATHTVLYYADSAALKALLTAYSQVVANRHLRPYFESFGVPNATADETGVLPLSAALGPRLFTPTPPLQQVWPGSVARSACWSATARA